MTNSKKKGRSGKGRLAAGGALAAAAIAAVAGAGYYFYASKDAKKHRRETAKWAKDLKSDVVKRARALKKINRDTVAGIVKQSARAYEGVRNLDRGEIDRAARELKNNWRKIAQELKKGGVSGARAARRVGKTLAKRAKRAKKA